MLGNIEDGFYIAPAFLDKLSIHVAKNFLDLPKIKVPLILGAAPAFGLAHGAPAEQLSPACSLTLCPKPCTTMAAGRH